MRAHVESFIRNHHVVLRPDFRDLLDLCTVGGCASAFAARTSLPNHPYSDVPGMLVGPGLTGIILTRIVARYTGIQ